MRRANLALLAVMTVALPALAADSEVYKADAPLRKLRSVKLDADVGAVKRFDVYPDAPAGKLYTLEVEHSPEVKPRATLAGGTLTLTSEQPRFSGKAPEQEWDVHLSRTPVWDMDLSFGAARGILELSGMKVRQLEVSAGAATVEVFWEKGNQVPLERLAVEGGASRIKLRGLGHARVQDLAFEGGAGTLDLDFSGPMTGTCQVSIQAGVGAIELKVPKAVGIRVVDKDVTLAQISWPDDLDRGRARETPNYAKARGRLDLKLKAAVGRIRIARI